MIRSSPCDFYLKYLVTHPDDYSDDQIRNLVKLQHLDFLGMAHLGELRENCVRPRVFYPEDSTHHESQRFLKKEKIYSLYNWDEDVVCAVKLLDHPRGKELAESLLVTDATPSWICSALRRVNFKATSRGIQLYKHYYFNTELVDRTELRAILGMRGKVTVNNPDDPDEQWFKVNYANAAKNSPAKLTSEISMPPLAQALNLMRLGFMPSTLEVSRVVSMGRMAASIRAVDCSVMGKSKQALDFSMTAKILSELAETVGDAGNELQAELMKMTMRTETAPVPTLDEVTGGDHTVDMILAEGQNAESEVQ